MDNNNYLMHFGVKGMKWGVRRYRNYDGSLTQAGVKRYNAAEKNYDEKHSKYKDLKQRYKSGEIDRATLKKAKKDLKASEKNLRKHYKHLKQDKLADQGKELYSRGYTISGMANARQAAVTGAYLVSLYVRHCGDIKLSNRMLGATATIDLATRFVSANRNRKLRAYYAHSSKY